MSSITEVKTGAVPTTDLICPLMSGQLVAIPGRPGTITTPGGPVLAPSVISCAREKCQWWDESGDGCCILETATEAVGDLSNSMASLRSVVSGSILSIKDVLEPATESPLVRIGDTLNQIWKMLNRIENRASSKNKDPF